VARTLQAHCVVGLDYIIIFSESYYGCFTVSFLEKSKDFECLSAFCSDLHILLSCFLDTLHYVKNVHFASAEI